MPLLRLLNQITNMYQNVKDTQTELREQQPHPYVSRTNAKPPASQSGMFLLNFFEYKPLVLTLFQINQKYQYQRLHPSNVSYLVQLAN